jgi:HD-like signal output (HDOD) protein
MDQAKSGLQRIKKVTESIIGLPTLPTIVSKMIDQVDSPRTSTAALARLIASDQALTAKVLKFANSAYYGFPREISTVNMAIVVLGFNAVKEMGLSLSVFDVFKKTPSNAYFDVTLFWEHSVGCGVAARMLARTYKPALAGEAFVAGLLHDVGKVILKQYFDTEFAEIIKAQQERNVTLEEAELATIETTHSQIGNWLAEKWNLPELICETIRCHHTPWETDKEPLFLACVTIADYLCHISKTGQSGRFVPPVLDPRIWALFTQAGFQLDDSGIPALLSEFLLEFDKSDNYMAMMRE